MRRDRTNSLRSNAVGVTKTYGQLRTSLCVFVVNDRAVRIEIASPKNKSCLVKGVAPLPFFQLVSNGVKLLCHCQVTYILRLLKLVPLTYCRTDHPDELTDPELWAARFSNARQSNPSRLKMWCRSFCLLRRVIKHPPRGLGPNRSHGRDLHIPRR